MKEVYASLDFGSSTIKLIVAEVINSTINIVYSKKVPSHGINKGIIEDIDAVVEDIKKVVQDAGEDLKAPIKKVLVSLPSVDCALYRCKGSTTIFAEDKIITSTDVLQALKHARQFDKSNAEYPVSSLPIRYLYDNVETNKVPIGKSATNLIVDALIITQLKSTFYPYIKVVENAGLEIMDVCINSYAAAKEVFDEASLEDGAILIDIGGDTSTVSYYQESFLQFLNVEMSGSNDFSRYLARAWKIDESKAELLKVKYGSCKVDTNDQDIVQIVGEKENQVTYRKSDLSATLIEGVEVLFNKINNKLRRHYTLEGKKIYVTGGGADLAGIEEVATRIFGVPVNCYRPDKIGARDMSYINNLGIIYYILDSKAISAQTEVSVVLPSISNTVALTRGLTKVQGEKKHVLKDAFDKIIVDDEE